MGEWWTYRPDDFLMFSLRAWYRLLELHNRAWWPMQAVAVMLGAGLMWAVHLRLRAALRLGLMLAGASLLFVAWAFHWGPHAGINLAAPYFAFAFGIEGLLLIGVALLRSQLVLSYGQGTTPAGVALLGAAVLLYPISALLWTRPLAQAEWFALAPDPTMLATLAVLLLLCGGQGLQRPRRTCTLLLVLPLVWCAVTGAMSWALDAPGWWIMPAAAVLVCAQAVSSARLP